MNHMEQTQNTVLAQNYTKCPICAGSGWELFLKPEELYGGKMIEIFRKCPRCLRNDDFVGVSPQLKDANMEAFNFTAYTVNVEKIKKLAFSIINDFNKWSNLGKGIYLWSKTPGSGKTFLACCIAQTLMTRYDLKTSFTTAPDYITAVGNSYKRERGEIDNSEVYRKCKILVLDDIGTQVGKEWQQQELFSLINKRLSERNITIYTSNMPPEKLNLENRTIDRIIKSSVTIQMPEESIRLKEARSEQERFLKDIIGV